MANEEHSAQMNFETENINSISLLTPIANVKVASQNPIVSFVPGATSSAKGSNTLAVSTAIGGSVINNLSNVAVANIVESLITARPPEIRARRQYRLLKKSPAKTSPLKKIGPTLKTLRTRLKCKQTSPKKLKCILPKQVQKRPRAIRAKAVIPPPLPSTISMPITKSALPLKSNLGNNISADHFSTENLSSSNSTQNQTMNDSSTNNDVQNSALAVQQQQQEEHLMAFLKASSTIEKGGYRQPKRRPRLNKQQKKLQDKIRALSYVPDLKSQEEALVRSYLLKVQKALTNKDPKKFEEFVECLNSFSNCSGSTEKLYFKVCDILSGFDELKDEFVMFLTLDQAIQVGKYEEYYSFLLMREFIDELKFHSHKQQQHLPKVVKVLNFLQNKEKVTPEDMIENLKPLLQFQPQLLDNLAQIFSSSQPVKSLADDFEEIKLDDSQSKEDVELMTMVDNSSEAKNLENCFCKCHESSTTNSNAGKVEHCVSCGLRFIDGRVFFQYGKMVRPVKISYVVDKKEELLNAATDSSSISKSKTKQKQKKLKDKTATNDEEKPKKGRGNKRKLDKMLK